MWKVEYKVGKGPYGYDNFGWKYFKAHEDAEDFIRKFKKENDGWTSEISEPEQVPYDESELEE